MNSEEHFAPIAALDLDPIKAKLMHQESGQGWTRAYADAVEFEYRRFLYLVKKFPNEQAAPLFDVDVFWHYHILDTMKYAADCESVFGYFLHHFPYLGLRGDDDLEAHQRVGERMRELYEQTYGESYIKKEQSPRLATSAKVAFSLPATQLNFPVPSNNAGSHQAVLKVAFSLPATQFAFCLPTSASGSSVDTAWFPPATLSGLTRPTLANEA